MLVDFLKGNHFFKEIATLVAMGVKEPCHPKVGNFEE
jgi:hypothetical protein